MASAPSDYGSAPSDFGTPYGGVPGRPTIQIGRRRLPGPRGARSVERIAAHPDRIAMWAVLLGVFLVLIAVATAHAGTPAPHALESAHHGSTALGLSR